MYVEGPTSITERAPPLSTEQPVHEERVGVFVNSTEGDNNGGSWYREDCKSALQEGAKTQSFLNRVRKQFWVKREYSINGNNWRKKSKARMSTNRTAVVDDISFDL